MERDFNRKEGHRNIHKQIVAVVRAGQFNSCGPLCYVNPVCKIIINKSTFYPLNSRFHTLCLRFFSLFPCLIPAFLPSRDWTCKLMKNHFNRISHGYMLLWMRLREKSVMHWRSIAEYVKICCVFCFILSTLLSLNWNF